MASKILYRSYRLVAIYSFSARKRVVGGVVNSGLYMIEIHPYITVDKAIFEVWKIGHSLSQEEMVQMLKRDYGIHNMK